MKAKSRATRQLATRAIVWLPRGHLQHQQTTKNVNTITLCVDGGTELFLSTPMCSITSFGPAINAGTELGCRSVQECLCNGGQTTPRSDRSRAHHRGSCYGMKPNQARQPFPALGGRSCFSGARHKRYRNPATDDREAKSPITQSADGSQCAMTGRLTSLRPAIHVTWPGDFQ